MNKFIFPVFGFLFFIFSCNSGEKSDANLLEKKDASFFPVSEFIEGQINSIGNSPVTPLHITMQNDLVDSVWISRESIRQYSEPFLNPKIDSAFLTSYFESESFLDQTVNLITFTYTAKNSLPESIRLRDIFVYINPESKTITKLYLLKESYLDHVRTTIQLTWQTDKWFSITTILQKDNEEVIVKEEKVIWNFD